MGFNECVCRSYVSRQSFLHCIGTDHCSAGRPLTIVTGRGSHSVNGVGVLAPAVRKALEAEGWNVGRWAAGLMVRGRTRMDG